jgi:hypothetical protein
MSTIIYYNIEWRMCQHMCLMGFRNKSTVKSQPN